MNQNIYVVGMALVMFIVTFLFGYLPTRLKTSKRLMNLVAIYGAGLLVGAAIIVILPEGMLVLFQSLALPRVDVHDQGLLPLTASSPQNESLPNQTAADELVPLNGGSRTVLADGHGGELFDPRVTQYVGLSLIFGFTIMLLLDQGFLILKEHQMNKNEQQKKKDKKKGIIDSRTAYNIQYNEPQNHPSRSFEVGNNLGLHKEELYQINHSRDHTITKSLAEPLLGVDNANLASPKNIGGQIRKEMYSPCSIDQQRFYRGGCETICTDKAMMVKQVSQRKQSSSEPAHEEEPVHNQTHHKKHHHHHQEGLEMNDNSKLHVHEHGDHFHMHEHDHGGKENILVTTIGLVIHSLADGTALGATFFLSDKEDSTNKGLGLLIFIAILLHKAPAAIGFGTFLQHEGVTKWTLIKHLSAFTSAAPIAATISYFFLLWLEQDSNVTENTLMFWVGLLLLISAGSFLYVATIHILPEVYCNTDIHRPHSHHHLPEDHVHDNEHYSKPVELISILLGLLTPYLLIFGHAH